MNPYLKASLEELVELINGANDNHLPPINTHEEYLQAVEEHKVLTAELHYHIDEFNKHCDNVDIANVASTIVEEIQSKGISVEDDMQIVLDIISKNTGIKISTEEALTVFIIYTLCVLILSIIVTILKVLQVKKSKEERRSREFDSMEKTVRLWAMKINDQGVKESYEKLDTVGKGIDKLVDSEASKNKTKAFKITKIPKYLHDNKTSKIFINAVGTIKQSNSEFNVIVRNLLSSITTVSYNINSSGKAIEALFGMAAITKDDREIETLNTRLSILEKHALDKTHKSIEADLIKLLQKTTNNNSDEIKVLETELVLEHADVEILLPDYQPFSRAIIDSIQSINALNNSMSTLTSKFDNMSNTNKRTTEAIKHAFESAERKAGKDNKHIKHVNDVSARVYKALEHDFFGYIKLSNHLENVINLHYLFMKEISTHMKNHM